MLDAAALSTLRGGTVSVDRAEAVLSIVTARAKSYTRGVGFRFNGESNPELIEPDIQTVILTASLRLLANPLNVERESMSVLSVQHGTDYQGWTLSETQVLNRYRMRAK